MVRHKHPVDKKGIKNMKDKNFIIFVACLTGLYFLLFIPANNGWGYPSYGTHYHGGSIFYWGGPDYYYDRDLRSSSRIGGGIHSGK